MYLDYCKRRIEELGAADDDALQPCTPDELATLEAMLGCQLPPAYRELLLWCGHSLDEALGGLGLVDYHTQSHTDLRKYFRQSLVERGHNPAALGPDSVIIEFNLDGYFCFLRATEGADPPLYIYNPDDGQIACCSERFSDYFALQIENGLGPGGWEYLRSPADLDRLSHAIEDIHGLLFWGGLRLGSVPAGVFRLRELRYLNLVGKGLLELSPRIAELQFLKRLHLARNSLASLPFALAQLDELEELDLADNQFSTVPPVLLRLPALRRCWLAGNPLPAEQLSRLRRDLPQVEFIAGPAASFA